VSKTAFLFPGQGAQIAGMGADVAEACPAAMVVYEKANEVLGYDLKRLCFEGPEDRLAATDISQPAIFVTSAALLAAWRCEAPRVPVPDVTAGLSLGEYTALYAAGILDFADALRLVQERGRAMQAAAEASEGGMVSVIGLDEADVQRLCEDTAEGQLLVCANFNCPGQIVVSGQRQACERLAARAPEYGAIKAVPLKVAGAFHTSMMQPAADALRRTLEQTPVAEPAAVAVLANVDAEYYTTAQAVREGLVRQLIKPILWQRCMERLLTDGVETFYEIGPGRVLTGLMKRIHRRAKVVNLSSAESLRSALSGA